MTDADPDLPSLPSLPTLPPLPQIGEVSRRPPPGGARRVWQQTTVTEIRVETHRMKTFRLACDPPLLHVAGQHVVVRLTAPDGYSASRSYSIASAPGDGSAIEIMVERLDDGEVSMYLHDGVIVGDQIELRGAFGGWFIWRGNTPALLVGGGSGVVPLMSMLRYHRELSAKSPSRQRLSMNLAVSVRGPDELPFADEYGDESTVVYTRRAPDGWTKPVGRLNAEMLSPLLIPDATAYVCGSAGFADHASQLLVDLGQPSDQIRVERYGPTS